MRGDDGVTLIETLVVALLLLVVTGIVSQGVVSALKSQSRQIARVEALGDAKLVLERVTREIRAADPLEAPLSPDSIGMRVRRRGAERRLRVSVVDGELRMAQTVGASTVTTTRLADLAPTGAPVFRYFDASGAELAGTVAPDAVASVAIDVVIVLPGGHGPVALSDLVTVRNASP